MSREQRFRVEWDADGCGCWLFVFDSWRGERPVMVIGGEGYAAERASRAYREIEAGGWSDRAICAATEVRA